MVVDFSKIDLQERPVLILKNAQGTPMGVISLAKNVTCNFKYNETSTIDFELPAYINGDPVPFYSELTGMSVVELRGIGQFILVNPSEIGDGVTRYKKIKGYSLEYELTRKKVTIAEGVYRFGDTAESVNSLLSYIMPEIPLWTIASIDPAIKNKYRTLDTQNENIYNLIKGTIQDSFGCIFDFDTINRKIYIRDVNRDSLEKPVFLSNENLAREIELSENTENIITRLDVNGDSGVNIRSVNPTGSNRLINLDYFMNPFNFPQPLIDKYHAWKKLCRDQKDVFYLKTLSLQSAGAKVLSVGSAAEGQKSYLKTLNTRRAVCIEAILQNLLDPTNLYHINQEIEAAEQHLAQLQTQYNEAVSEKDQILADLKAIQNECAFQNYFTTEEQKQIQPFFIDGEISEPTFSAALKNNYNAQSVGMEFEKMDIHITDAEVTEIPGVSGNTILKVKSGKTDIFSNPGDPVVSAIFDIKPNNQCVVSMVVSDVVIDVKDDQEVYATACCSIVTEYSNLVYTEKSVTLNATGGNTYATFDGGDFEKSNVESDLYEYGESCLNSLAYPTYTFSVESANFFELDEFRYFKNHIQLGERIYLDTGSHHILKPIFIGVSLSYDRLSEMQLEFSDEYSAFNSTFKLVDLLNESIQMGKDVSVKKHNYSSFVDTGASDRLYQFVENALDVSKNEILSSDDISVSWDSSGLKLRKWADYQHTSFEPEQIWMINNNIVMTDDSWSTAKMAIGKFEDDKLGTCWGIAAPMVAGTMIAGSALVIESETGENGHSSFIVDKDGCRLYNSFFEIETTRTHLLLHPAVGIVIGDYELITDDGYGHIDVNEENAKFWADPAGNLHLKGNLDAATGSFTGSVTATELIIKNGDAETGIDDYISENVTVGGSIASIQVLYATSNAPDTAPTGDWSPTIPPYQEGVYIWQKSVTTKNDGTVTESDPSCISGLDGKNGISAALLSIRSSQGTVFKNNDAATDLTVEIYYGTKVITSYAMLQESFPGASLQWSCLKPDQTAFEVLPETDPHLSENGFKLAVTSADVNGRVTYQCDLMVNDQKEVQP